MEQIHHSNTHSCFFKSSQHSKMLWDIKNIKRRKIKLIKYLGIDVLQCWVLGTCRPVSVACNNDVRHARGLVEERGTDEQWAIHQRKVTFFMVIVLWARPRGVQSAVCWLHGPQQSKESPDQSIDNKWVTLRAGHYLGPAQEIVGAWWLSRWGEVMDEEQGSCDTKWSPPRVHPGLAWAMGFRCLGSDEDMTDGLCFHFHHACWAQSFQKLTDNMSAH